jgi:5-formyltetrahydrofolate cyclo-ligase
MARGQARKQLLVQRETRPQAQRAHADRALAARLDAAIAALLDPTLDPALGLTPSLAPSLALAPRLDPTLEPARGTPLEPEFERAQATRAPVIGVYWPIRGEPDLRPWYESRWQRGWRLALPRTRPASALEFGLWDSPTTLQPGPWGAALPEPFEPVVPDLLVIPCLGFDAHRRRLGYGGGYYDRTLAQWPRPSVGVAHEIGRLGELVAQPHDIALDCIVTEASTLGPEPSYRPRPLT